MRRTLGKKTLILMAAALVFSVAGLNCAQHQSDVGELRLALSAPGGYTINSVGYTVNQGATILLSGTFDVSDPNATPSLDIVLPPSIGDTITLKATATNGHQFQGTSSAFNIVSGNTTQVTVTLQDTLGTPTPADGILIVNGTIVPNDNPPVIDSVVVAPSQASVGTNIAVAVVAHDPDVGDTLTYAWTATPAGTFALPAVQSTTYSSPAAGTQTLRITVTDNRGASVFADLPVNIIGAAGTGAAGTGAAGTGAAGTGAAGAAGTGAAGTGAAGTGAAGTGAAGTGAAGTGAAGTGAAGTGAAGTGAAGTGAAGTGAAGTGAAGTGAAGTGAAGTGAAGTGAAGNLLGAADFELNGPDAQADFLDCDPGGLSASPSIVDANGNSWGPNTLATPAQTTAALNLLHAINLTIGTSDAPGPGPGGSIGLHGWPNLNPRLAGVGTNAANTGPGVFALNGGLIGFGVNVASSLSSGALNGELASLYKAAAVADGLLDKTVTPAVPLTLASSNAAFALAIAPVTTNPKSSIGLVDNIVQCAFSISLGYDPGTGTVIANPTTFTPNVVEGL